MRRRFSRLALAVTAVAVLAIAGAVTYAVADIGGGGVINGCYKSQNGQLRVIDPATDSCNPSEKPISWSQTGPAGAKGATGATGAQGPTGPTGANGVNGAKGATGPTGANGINGTNGAKGATGPTGLTGPKGDKGDTGANGAGGPSVGAIVNESGTLLFGTTGVTVTKTGTGAYHITIPAGTFTGAAMPVFTAVSNGATAAGLTTNFTTFVDIVFSKDAAFTMLMTQFKP